MMTARDPITMSPTDRLAEVADILAVGYLRLLGNRRNPVDLSGQAEALSGVLTGGDTSPRKEAS